MTRKRLEYPAVGAYSAGKHSVLALRLQERLKTESQAQFQLMTDWILENNYSRDQCMRLIAKKVLFATKLKGRIWVRVNPNCFDALADT